jgi:hypothetical protein
VVYEEMKGVLRPFMERLYKIPERNIRKQLANQFYGRLGRKNWQNKYKIIRLAEMQDMQGLIKRSKNYGDYELIETQEINKTTNRVENLA